MTKHIPNILTLLNLLSGCLAILFLLTGGYAEAAVLVMAALIFDFLDGFTARWLNAYSDLGRELDSLADLVSFGLVPGLVMYKLMILPGNAPSLEYHGIDLAGIPAFIITLMSAMRLAIFNIDDSQSSHFRGMPTPANAIFIVSLPIILVSSKENFIIDIIRLISENYYYLLGMVLLLSFLLISPLKLLSLKIRPGDKRDNLYRYILASVAAVCILLMGITAIPLIIVFYILLSVIWQWKII